MNHSQNVHPHKPVAVEATTQDPNSLSMALRERTRQAHTRAERHPQQARLVKGEATRAQYAAWLGQMLPVWREVDRGLVVNAAHDPRVGAMLHPYHAHAGRIEADLAYLGESAQGHEMTPATRRMCELVASEANAAEPGIVGIWYVLEGSANGGKYIARAISKSMHIPGPEGLMSLDPHGEAQRERWERWRRELDSQGWSEAERAKIIEAANATFDGIYELLEDLDRSTGDGAATGGAMRAR
ncbi:MAG: hypothetical protein GC200_10850 [Tepidisphaera sp.]|nr:hypothetical protein [Tepidisphaera sp.]